MFTAASKKKRRKFGSGEKKHTQGPSGSPLDGPDDGSPRCGGPVFGLVRKKSAEDVFSGKKKSQLRETALFGGILVVGVLGKRVKTGVSEWLERRFLFFFLLRDVFGTLEKPTGR